MFTKATSAAFKETSALATTTAHNLTKLLETPRLAWVNYCASFVCIAALFATDTLWFTLTAILAFALNFIAWLVTVDG